MLEGLGSVLAVEWCTVTYRIPDPGWIAGLIQFGEIMLLLLQKREAASLRV